MNASIGSGGTFATVSEHSKLTRLLTCNLQINYEEKWQDGLE